VVARRLAIAHLLQYLASGEPDELEASVTAARKLEGRLGRHENRYWYYYILAHRALEKGHRFDFVGDVLSLWLGVVVPLESPYETLETLSLTESPNSGFAAALPYIYENVARLILIRSQQMGLDRDVDPLCAIVRLLADNRGRTHRCDPAWPPPRRVPDADHRAAERPEPTPAASPSRSRSSRRPSSTIRRAAARERRSRRRRSRRSARQRAAPTRPR
jgi:hypothetical protein